MRMLLGVLIFLLLAGSGSAPAADLYISTTGNDTTGDGSAGNPWLTLSKAMTSASSGDTIHAAAGTYSAPFIDVPGKTLTVIGDAPSRAAVFEWDNTSSTTVGWLYMRTTGADLTLQNIKFTQTAGAVNTYGLNLEVGASESITLKLIDCEINDNASRITKGMVQVTATDATSIGTVIIADSSLLMSYDSPTFRSHPIRSDVGSTITLTDCVVTTTNSSHGIMVTTTTSFTMTRCTVTNTGSKGYMVSPPTSGACMNFGGTGDVVIADSVFDFEMGKNPSNQNHENGIAVYGDLSNFVMTGCTLTGKWIGTITEARSMLAFYNAESQDAPAPTTSIGTILVSDCTFTLKDGTEAADARCIGTCYDGSSQDQTTGYWMDGCTSMTISKCTFICEAGQGVVIGEGVNALTIKKSTFTHKNVTLASALLFVGRDHLSGVDANTIPLPLTGGFLVEDVTLAYEGDGSHGLSTGLGGNGGTWSRCKALNCDIVFVIKGNTTTYQNCSGWGLAGILFKGGQNCIVNHCSVYATANPYYWNTQNTASPLYQPFGNTVKNSIVDASGATSKTLMSDLTQDASGFYLGALGLFSDWNGYVDSGSSPSSWAAIGDGDAVRDTYTSMATVIADELNILGWNIGNEANSIQTATAAFVGPTIGDFRLVGGHVFRRAADDGTDMGIAITGTTLRGGWGMSGEMRPPAHGKEF